MQVIQYQPIFTSVILYLFSEKSFYKRDYLCYYPSTLALYDQSTIVFDCKSKLTSIICVMHEVIDKNKQQQLQSTSSWNYNGQGSLLITQFHKWIIVWISPMYTKLGIHLISWMVELKVLLKIKGVPTHWTYVNSRWLLHVY